MLNAFNSLLPHVESCALSFVPSAYEEVLDGSFTASSGRYGFDGSGSLSARGILSQDRDGHALAQPRECVAHDESPGRSDVQPKVRQARHQHNEQWYSTNLAMIKEHLMRVFMVDGDPSQVDAIKKKTCP